MPIQSLDDLERIKEKGIDSLYPSQGNIKLVVGTATCGRAAGAEEVLQVLENQEKKSNSEFSVAKTGCLGFCEKEPLVELRLSPEARIIYREMTPEKVKELIEDLLDEGIHQDWALCRIGEDLPFGNTDAKNIPLFEEVDFYKSQERVILGNSGLIDPLNMAEYIALGGYFSLYQALQIDPNEIIQEISASNLRGRGGAGFPTGLKWSFTRKASGDEKYIICNADEGDPGAYMDRSILEGTPHSVLEGMIIGAYAIGARKGYIYVRAEYPLAVKTLKRALQQAEDRGLLGENILNSGFDFQIRIKEGAGAFVCGEETALMASIGDERGMPRPRPPFPAQSGLWDRPTNINNVETWANIPSIIHKGATEYATLGTEKSAGTKVFSLVGKVKNTGLVEVPMGTTLFEIVHGIGGGAIEGRVKAVQTGGPSGGCIPEELLDLPVDYESLQEAGSIMGSGGMIVMDEETCMVDVARYFLSFVQEESCGKCTPCRIGTKRMLEILTRITQGRGHEDDLDLLKKIAEMVKECSLCGLGQTAPNPVLTTLRYFEDEYLTHIEEKRCPAGVCADLVTYQIVAEACRGCNQCKEACPQDAIEGEPGEVYQIDSQLCKSCGLCFEVCKFDAVEKL